MRIRGLSTISRSAEPLYIVDGVIIDNGSRQLVDLGGYTTNRLADLDPNDIERVEIVKGAAAAALYGSRVYRQRRYALFLTGTRWADQRRFGRIGEARTPYLPYPAQETVGNPNPPTTP